MSFDAPVFCLFVSVNNLGISIATLDAARNNGLISYVQYVQNGCVYFTSAGLQEYIAKCTHRAKPAEKNATYRKPRRAGV
ncbi:DNA-binding protein [Coprococcus catus]|uniref:DNA-binding protein n=1 Tax=Coprococcus catus TaxID=116085 RepID=A0A3E2TP57_9FIRM|nr:DNA-binding protein [Coprococcus catus]